MNTFVNYFLSKRAIDLILFFFFSNILIINQVIGSYQFDHTSDNIIVLISVPIYFKLYWKKSIKILLIDHIISLFWKVEGQTHPMTIYNRHVPLSLYSFVIYFTPSSILTGFFSYIGAWKPRDESDYLAFFFFFLIFLLCAYLF